jgi:hypothetical protein
MKTYKFHLLRERAVPKVHLKEVHTCIHRNKGPVEVSLVNKPIGLPMNEDGEVLWAPTFEYLESWRADNNIDAEDFVYALTASPNEKNWYAVNDVEGNPRNGFGHVDDYEWVTSAPCYVLTVHYILKTLVNVILQESGKDYQEEGGHSKAIGCFGDFCADKRDLALKLKTGDICGDCLNLFQECKISDELIQQIIAVQEFVRSLAIASAPYLKKADGFPELPFPVAITKHKASHASNPLHELNTLIDHFDSLVRYSTIALSALKGKTLEVEEKPSLGWWVEELARTMQGDAQYKRAVTVAQEEKIVRIRNETRGHGWTSPSEHRYEPIVIQLHKAIAEMEDVLSSLFYDYKLVIPENTKPSGGHYVISGIKLSGSNMLHSRFEEEVDIDPVGQGFSDVGPIYLVGDQYRKFYNLSPLIVREICPECDNERILITDGSDVYIDTFAGHRTTLNV